MDLFENNRLSSLTIAHPALRADQATYPASLATVITPGLEEHHIITQCLLSVYPALATKWKYSGLGTIIPRADPLSSDADWWQKAPHFSDKIQPQKYPG